MYKVYVNGELTFNDQLPDEDLVLIKPKLVLEDNQPGTFDFTLPLNHRHVNKTNSLGRPFCGSLIDTVTIYKNGEWLWEGRPVSETSDFLNQRVIHCEGCLGYLKDSIQPLNVQVSTSSLSTAVWSFLEALISRHNKQLESIGKEHDLDFSERMIYLESGVSIVTVTPKDVSSFTRITNYETTLESINKRLINKLGGHIRIRRATVNGVSKLVLDYLKDYPDTSSQKIEFGKNLLDYNKSVDMTEIATVIIPRGDTVQEDSPFYRDAAAFANISQRAHLGWFNVASNGEPVGDQRIYAGKDVIEEYGYAERVVDFENITAKYATSANGYSRSTGWSSIESYRNTATVTKPTSSYYKIDYLWALKILGEDYLTNLQFEKLELELSVFDLTNLGVTNAQDFKLLDNVICSSKPHGMINKSFPIQKMTIMLDDPEDTKITLGESKKKSISTTAGVSASVLAEDPGDYSDYYKNLLLKAKYQADALIDGAASGLSNGYMTIIQKTADDESRYSDGIIISNQRILPSEMAGTNDYLSSLRTAHPTMKFWIWNSGGLGYYDFSKGVNRLVTAITADGKIVADAITTGTLTAIKISACTITGSTFRCESSSGGYYVKVANGEITGGYGSTKYGTFDATFSIDDYHDGVNDNATVDNSYVTRRGFKFDCAALAFNAYRISVPWPSWIDQPENRPSGVTFEWLSGFTGILNNVMSHTGEGSYNYGPLKFVNGLLVSVDTTSQYSFADEKNPKRN